MWRRVTVDAAGWLGPPRQRRSPAPFTRRCGRWCAAYVCRRFETVRIDPELDQRQRRFCIEVLYEVSKAFAVGDYAQNWTVEVLTALPKIICESIEREWRINCLGMNEARNLIMKNVRSGPGVDKLIEIIDKMLLCSFSLEHYFFRWLRNYNNKEMAKTMFFIEVRIQNYLIIRFPYRSYRTDRWP